MDSILQSLNEPQRLAVEHMDGPLLVLAGAGSGKTRVITHRYAYLLHQKRLNLQNILAVTFTNKAAGEMKERIQALTGMDTRFAWIRTFHSTGMQLLRNHSELLGYPRQFGIYDDTDSKGLVKTIMKDMNISTERFNPQSIYHSISKSKDNMIDSETFKEEADSEFSETAAKVYAEYQQRLRKNKAVDFSDLISLPIKIFKENDSIRAKYHDMWKFIMVDEFQDTNTAQYEFLKLITNKEKNICVVGDDDQSIYGWRGARIDNIYDFKDSFHATTIALEQNYRSTKVILEAANQVVRHIPDRMQKELWTERESSEKIRLLEAGRDREEAAYIAANIKDQLNTYTYKDIAVFYRTNAQSRLLEEALLQKNIPYKIFGGQKFYERKEIKDILAYINITLNPHDQVAFERIINVPKRKIGPATALKIIQYADLHGVDFIFTLQQVEQMSGMGGAVTAKIQDLGQILQELHHSFDKMSPMNFVKVLIDAIGYKDYITAFDEDGLDRWSNVEELINSIRQFEENFPDATISDFLSEVSLQATTDDLADDSSRNYVSLMTIHNAKGLEYNVVFLSGVSDGLIPHSISTNSPREKEEERRLFYVAITRAKDLLFMSFPRSRMKYGDIISSQPSPFLQDIPEELLDREVIDAPVVTTAPTTKGYGRTTQTNKMKSKSYEKPWKESDFNKEIKKEIKTREIESLESLSIGDPVYHHSFGVGKISFLSPRMIKVEFDDYGIKVLGGNMTQSLEKVVENE